MNSPATQADPLANLKDIHLPPDISVWPIASGWWLLALTIILIITVAYLFFRLAIQRKAYRKAALKELMQLETATLEPDAFAEKIAVIIRRTALVTAKNSKKTMNMAQLHGIEWRNYLQQSMPAEQAEIIAIGRYKPLETLDKAALLKAAEQWIKGHKA